MLSTLRHFWFSLAATAIIFGLVVGYFGTKSVFIILVLMAIELSLSFDNAVVNAKILTRLSPFWQKMFLTVGIFIAIFGMRVFFPLAIVSATSQLPLGTVLDMALNQPEKYAHELEQSHVAIVAFGGAFLLMLTLHFFGDPLRKVHWINQIEKPLQRIHGEWLPAVITISAVVAIALASGDHARQAITAGVFGVVTYEVIRLLLKFAERATGRNTTAHQTGMAAFVTFIYLEILDASFSFDGVIGAFALTNDVILIAAGLGVGAVWVRSLTIFMVRRGTLAAYKYLEHGAHYAIAVLAAVMLTGIIWEVPEVFTGLASVGLIGASLVASKRSTALKIEPN